MVVASHGDDVIVLGIFSRIPQTLLDTWVLIRDQHAEFADTGLKKSSILRAEKIAVIHESVLHRKLGEMPANLISEVEEALKRALTL
jgi:mRNA interferase MazF